MFFSVEFKVAGRNVNQEHNADADNPEDSPASENEQAELVPKTSAEE
jgi:hypothetical protein